MRRAGSVCQDLGTSVKHTKNQRDYMENFSPASWDPGIAIAIAGPTLSRH